MTAQRSVAVGFVAALVLWLSVAVTAGAAQEGVKPGTTSGASVAQTGWWWRANDNPADGAGVIAPPEAPAPHVPEGALPSSAAAGDPEKVSAIGFSLKYGPGAVVQSFLLSLKESGEPGANVNADGETTKVVACPVTEAFWIGGEAGKWSAVPEYDCEVASAPGERSSSGVWTFDLTSMATTWLAKDSAQPAAIVLVEDVEAPESFQVAFDGTKNGVGLKLDATGGAAPLPPPPAGAVGTGESGAGGSSGSFGGGVPADGGDVPAGAPVTGEAPTAAEPARDTPQVAAGQTGPATQLVGLFEDLPGGALFLLPIALGMAYLIMLALGPNGEPALATARHGVGRVLDRMRAAGSKEDR